MSKVTRAPSVRPIGDAMSLDNALRSFVRISPFSPSFYECFSSAGDHQVSSRQWLESRKEKERPRRNEGAGSRFEGANCEGRRWPNLGGPLLMSGVTRC
jgi:hypothetical protein